MWAPCQWLLLSSAVHLAFGGVGDCGGDRVSTSPLLQTDILLLQKDSYVRKTSEKPDGQDVSNSSVQEARHEAGARKCILRGILSRWCHKLERFVVNGDAHRFSDGSGSCTCEAVLASAILCFVFFAIVVFYYCCPHVRPHGPPTLAGYSAANISFAVTFYFLPDPLYFLNLSGLYMPVGQATIRFGSGCIIVYGCIHVFEWPVQNMLPHFASLDQLAFVGVTCLLLGCYLCLLRFGQDSGVKLIVRELTRCKPGNVADAYWGGRNQFLDDLAKVLDRDSMTAVRRLLKDREELRTDIAARCLKNEFFNFMDGDASSVHTLLVTLVLTAPCPSKMNVNPSLRKAVRQALHCKPDLLSEIFLQYAYPNRKNIQSYLGPHEDDYGKAMLGLSAYLLPTDGQARSRLLLATMSMVGTDDRNLTRLLLCCSSAERKAMVRAYTARHNEVDYALSNTGALLAAVTDGVGSSGGIIGNMLDWMQTSSDELYQQALTTVIQDTADVKMMYIKVIAAHNLPHMETCGQGKNDCFVEVRVGDDIVKTKVVSNSDSDPRWDEDMKPIAVAAQSPPRVDIRVMESDGILGNTPFGQYIADTPWSMEGLHTFSLDPDVICSKESKVVIKVVSAAGLPAGGRGAEMGFPWVRLTHGSMSQRSRSAADSVNPRWNEFLGSMPMLQEQPVSIEVLMSDTENADVLGQYSFKLHDLEQMQRKQPNPQAREGQGTLEKCPTWCAGDLRSLLKRNDSKARWIDVDFPLLGKRGNRLPGEPTIHLAIQLVAHKPHPTKKKMPGSGRSMTVTLETSFYDPGQAPWENTCEHFETTLREEMRHRKRKSTLLRLLCTARDDTLQSIVGGELLDSVLEFIRPESGVLRDYLDMLIRDNRTTPERPFSERYLVELEACMSETTMGIPSTDELGLICLLLCIDANDRPKLPEQYHARFGRDLFDDLHHATSDSVVLEALVLGLAHHSNDWLWARTLYEAMHGGWTGVGTDESTLTDVLVLNYRNLQGLEEQYLDVTTRRGGPEDLVGAITSETSGKYRTFLLSLLTSAHNSA